MCFDIKPNNFNVASRMSEFWRGGGCGPASRNRTVLQVCPGLVCFARVHGGFSELAKFMLDHSSCDQRDWDLTEKKSTSITCSVYVGKLWSQFGICLGCLETVSEYV